MTRLIVASLFALAGLSSLVSATTYANFCDDDNCSVNCGISVSLDNPGCLAESGRKSVGFHGTNIQDVHLIASPDDACSCQNDCYPDVVQSLDTANPSCLHLTGPEANSYRFVGEDAGGCQANQCG